MMTYLKAYVGVIVSFLVIDAVWIGFVVKDLYQREVGHLMASSPKVVPALLFYLLYAAGVVYLAVRPALTEASTSTAMLNGALLGAIAYGTFTMTNYATLKGWTMTLAVSDILWGLFITGVCATCGYLLAR